MVLPARDRRHDSQRPSVADPGAWSGVVTESHTDVSRGCRSNPVIGLLVDSAA